MIEERTTQLLQRAQQGDRDACDTLLCGQQERLYALCLRWTHNTTDAEDLAQETLLRACARLTQIQNVEALPSWLTQIAINICRNWLTRALQLGGKEVLEAVRDDPAFNYLRTTEAFQTLFS